MVEEFRQRFSVDGEDSGVLFFFPAKLEDGREFFAEFWPEARAVSDPKGIIFEHLGVQRASLRELLGPGVWFKLLKNARKGPRPGIPRGDVWRMPGMFLVSGAGIEWSWKFKDIGDHPDFDELRRIYLRPSY